MRLWNLLGTAPLARGRPPDGTAPGGENILATQVTPESHTFLNSLDFATVGSVEFRISSLQERMDLLVSLGNEANELQQSAQTVEQKNSWANLESRAQDEISRLQQELGRAFTEEETPPKPPSRRLKAEVPLLTKAESKEPHNPVVIKLDLPPPLPLSPTPSPSSQNYRIKPVAVTKSQAPPPPPTGEKKSVETKRSQKWEPRAVEVSLDWTGIRRSDTFYLTHQEQVGRQVEAIAQGIEQARREKDEHHELEPEHSAFTGEEPTSVPEGESLWWLEEQGGQERDESDSRRRSRGQYQQKTEDDD